MSTQNGKNKSVIVFVHGFGSDKSCWDTLVELLQSDREVTERFDFDFFTYPTSWINLKFGERIPDHGEIANKFSALLDSDHFKNRDLVLVGHSQGGLLIHAFLAQMLEKGAGEELDQVRQVITFATPHYGSITLYNTRRILSRIFKNLQNERLMPLDNATANSVRVVKDRIATTPHAKETHWPIPVHCFGGDTDNVVLPSSAQGPFSSFTTLSGNHSTILQPPNRDDDRYREFKEVLLDPIGHPYVFEIEDYHTHIKVRPVERQTFTIPLGNGRTREIETDNICELKRTVRFAKNNRCQNKFKIRYLAGNDSCFIAERSHKTKESHLDSEYKKAGEKIAFHIVPKQKSPDEEYYLYLKIFNGFGKGRRDVHFHLGYESIGAKAYYRKLRYTLDLSEYKAAGYKLSGQPVFYLHSKDPGGCEECLQKRKHAEEVIPAKMNRNGTWEWEFENVREGVADVLWDFEDE